MQVTNRSLVIVAAVLIGMGLLFLGLNFVPGWSFGMAWPLVFLLLAAGFVVPVFLFPMYREWIGALFIPASILLVIGLIFFYNTISGDWSVWAYAWLLLMSGVGLGLVLAGNYSNWGRGVVDTGLWLILIPLGLFALLGAIFGSPQVRVIAPVLLVLGGLALLARSLRRAPR